jgi:hypothetical protein
MCAPQQPPTNPFQRYVTSLYHFTDRRNLPSIRQLGGLFSLAKLKEKGAESLVTGGNDWSHEADTRVGMDRYVHLCLRPTHPMEFRAREDGRIKDTIFLQIHPEVLDWPGVRYTPDVSNKAGVTHYSIEEAKQLIDFEVLFTRTDWRSPSIQHRLQQAEKSEILVPDHIPLTLIRNIPNG